MSNYFKSIPNVAYDINGNAPNTFQKVTNIMKRPIFKPKVIDEITDYYPYRVKDGYRPDMVSQEVYGTPSYAYLILMFNDIYDPVFDWPLGSKQFENYIINKYGSIDSALTTVKYYYQIIRAEVARTGISERVPAVKYIIDQTAYDALGVDDKSTISEYDWEFELNDEKTDIKLINASIIADVDFEVKRMYAA
jgi:hypothetical protein